MSKQQTTDAHGWPDPARPGVPLNPERNGAHVIHWFGDDETWLWVARRRWWVNSTGRFLSDLEVGQAYGSRYLGPCLTFAEVAARVAEARDQGRIEGATLGAEELEAVRAEARAEGMREAAEIAASKRSNAALTTVSYKAGYATGVFEAAATILAAIEKKEPTT